MIERGSFIFYRSFKESLEDLSDSDKLIMYVAIAEYALDRIEPQLTGFPSALFKLIKPQLEANWRKFENGCKGANHGNKGGAPKGNKNASKEQTTPKQPLNNGKTTRNVNDNDNYNDNYNIESDWRKSFELYQEYVREGYQEVINDTQWIKKQQEYNPGVDITKSIEKSCVNFWSTAEGWANKKKSKSKSINWRTTFGNAISNSINKVYKDNNYKAYEDTRASQFGL